jgi:hypothetical protein
MSTRRAGGTLAASLLGLAAFGCGSSAPPPPPMLSVSQSMVSFNTAFGGSNPAATSVNVTNAGSGTLTFTAASDSPWLSVTPANGTAPQAIQVSATLGSLTTASYMGHITVTSAGVQGSPATINVTFAVGGPLPSNAPFWAQWGANPQHAGMVNVAGQNLGHQLADIVYDPFVPQEQAEQTGDLVVHYQAPILDGNDAYITVKSGTFNSCNPVGDWQNGTACGPNTWNTMAWNEARYTWENGTLVKIWSFASDWKPEPNASDLNSSGLGGWEPVFHPLDANNFIYVPGAAGTLWKVKKTDGTSASHIDPFSGMNQVVKANTYVAGPLASDAQGNIFYNVMQLADPSAGNPWSANDVVNAWLVRVTPSDATSVVTYTTLVPGAPPGSSNNCPGQFNANRDALPWPPTLTAVPPTVACGSQRPGVNVAPAIAPDGTIYTASVAHYDSQVSYLVAVKPDLSPKWAASLQNRLSDGCGFIVPIAPASNPNQANSCRNGATPGFDPRTNAMGSGEVVDQGSSSPTVLPDGAVLLGTYTRYNGARGHLLKFDALGNYVTAYDFGWDETPAVYTHNATYSIVIKDNHYPAKLYCGGTNPICQTLPAGPYYITQLNASLQIEWQFQGTNTMSCKRNPDGTLSCVSDHLTGFEWCINMPAIDMNGTVYVNSEDGNIYALPQGHSGVFTAPQSNLFLNLAVGAAYTPLSIGPDGKLYTQNDGHLFVVGN